MIEYPGDKSVRDAAAALGLPGQPHLILRDLARIIELIHLAETGNQSNLVLAGGMAMRCYKSTRFTIRDIDMSAQRFPVDRDQLQDVLAYEDETITIDCGPAPYWDVKNHLFIARPVKFRFHQGAIGVPDEEASFELTVSERGLLLPPVSLELPDLYKFESPLPKTQLWVMDKVEILAEKTLGSCVFGLQKHYSDIAYLSECYQFEVEGRAAQLGETLRKKLEDNQRRFPATYQAFPDVSSLKRVLRDPGRKHPDFATTWERNVRFLGGTPMTFERALEIVCDLYEPLL